MLGGQGHLAKRTRHMPEPASEAASVPDSEPSSGPASGEDHAIASGPAHEPVSEKAPKADPVAAPCVVKIKREVCSDIFTILTEQTIPSQTKSHVRRRGRKVFPSRNR